MTPERWQQVKEIFRDGLQHKGAERAAFLDRACNGDDDLRREVDSLLASFSDSDSIIEAPVTEAAAELLRGDRTESMVGKRLGHYEVVGLLGEGGMGTVYLAQDGKLGRQVALKLLPTHFTDDENRVWRFKQEARAASALNHPNIITIYEIGEIDSVHYLATEFVDGETLREAMTQGRMEVPAALDVIAQVASALAAAHEAGLVHRDIKPENLMLRRDGLVKVLDFGLAKLTELRIADSGLQNEETKPSSSQSNPQSAIRNPQLTDAGVVMGTARYMSPEQARGLQVDARTDIFSLGVVLHEMVTGRSPFAGETQSDVIAEILKTEPPPMSASGREIPGELQRIASKCLQKDREQRYSSARELMVDLKNIKRDLEINSSVTTAATLLTRRRLPGSGVWLAILALVMLVTGLSYWFLFRPAPAAVSPQITSLAVLPLENLSGDPEQEYFADGMTEALISNLAQIRALKVISRTSVMRYKGSDKSLPEIARELNVDAVIEGTVQRSGPRVRVTAQLIHAATDAHLWSRDYERDLTDVLKLQSEVAREVADEIRIQVTADERARLASVRSVNPQAHEAYLLGRYHFNKGNEQGWKQAIEYFDRAVKLAPDYAAAYAGLSDAWLQLGLFGGSFKGVEAPARAAALKAIGLDEQISEPHISLSNIKGVYDWDWIGAEQESKRAIELDPGSLQAHINYGHLLMALGRHNEAIREGQIAVQLDPVSATAQSALGRILYRARRYTEALPPLARAVELEPQSAGANFRLAEVYTQLGKYDEAIAAFKKAAIPAFGEVGGRSIGIARVYALSGRQREARQMIRNLKGPAISIAAVYAELGDKDEAFSILEKGIEERSSFLVYLKEDPPLEALHSDPRWRVLLQRMNFPVE